MDSEAVRPRNADRWPWLVVGLCGAIGLGLAADAARHASATYDEVAYFEIACRWFRTGEQEAIGRMGSPALFWKLQQAPTLFVLDRLGYGEWIDDPVSHQITLLPVLRCGALWIWLLAFVGTVLWARRLGGPRRMMMAAALFALSPNLIAHGALITMELPLVASWTLSSLFFCRFLESKDRRWLMASAIAAGVGFSCKFTTVLLPPILGLAWGIDRVRRPERPWFRSLRRIAVGMAGFGLVMMITNALVNAGAWMTVSNRLGEEHPSLEARFDPPWDALAASVVETPLPQDWAAFLRQTEHQRTGGPSYLFGERRMHGWWSYYLIALAVKVPLAFWILILGRSVLTLRHREDNEEKPDELLIVTTMLALLIITAVGSSRNYGVRYLLPMAPLAIIWVARLAESPAWGRWLAGLGLLGQAWAVVSIHPHELTYFNEVAGGPVGGRRILADSNLDWGQGALGLARLQRARPEFQDITVYAFGATDPGHYGVLGRRYVIDAGSIHPDLPERFEPETPFVAVSASLLFGPWGSAGYFDALRGQEPLARTSDTTFEIYRNPFDRRGGP